jgi:hypothetical protein
VASGSNNEVLGHHFLCHNSGTICLISISITSSSSSHNQTTLNAFTRMHQNLLAIININYNMRIGLNSGELALQLLCSVAPWLRKHSGTVEIPLIDMLIHFTNSYHILQ